MIKNLNEAYLDLRAELRARGMDNPNVEAMELICLSVGIEREDFQKKKQAFFFDKHNERLQALLERRMAGEPLQYLVGAWDFYGLRFELTRDVLIPRPETELLCELGIRAMRDRDKGRVLDLCCGSGCLGIALLKGLDVGVTGVLADVSENVLRVTRRNILRHGLTGRTLTALTDALGTPPDSFGRFNLIVCNPPYIPTGELDSLQAEVKREPRIALDGGADGLDFYRAIVRNYRSTLQRGGWLMFEVGAGQADAVADMLENGGYTDVHIDRDLQKIQRVVRGAAK